MKSVTFPVVLVHELSEPLRGSTASADIANDSSNDGTRAAELKSSLGKTQSASTDSTTQSASGLHWICATFGQTMVQDVLMTIEHNPDKDETRDALDEEIQEDEAVWDKARAEFEGFRKEQKAQPSGEVEKALHKWLRHHGITLDDDEVRTKAAKIAAGEAVELADVPSLPNFPEGSES